MVKYGKLLIVFRIRGTGQWRIDDISIEADQWYHVSATWNKDGALTGYINGVQWKQVGSTSYSVGSSPVSSNMHVGKPNNGNTLYGNVSLDDWYFWDRVLSSGDMETVYSMYFMQWKPLQILINCDPSFSSFETFYLMSIIAISVNQQLRFLLIRCILYSCVHVASEEVELYLKMVQ